MVVPIDQRPGPKFYAVILWPLVERDKQRSRWEASRSGYHDARPARDLVDIRHLAGIQIYHPCFPNQPHNGSHYLLLRADATYDWAQIFDPAHPVPIGRSLDATRRICVSPFPEDQGRVLYFSGYDGPYADNRSAWIHRATMPTTSTSTGGNGSGSPFIPSSPLLF